MSKAQFSQSFEQEKIKSLSSRFKEAAEFKKCEISKTNNQYKHGRLAENARLKPLLDLAARVIDAAELMCSQAEAGKRKADLVGSRIEMTISYGEVTDALTSLSARLDEGGKG